MSSFVCDLTFLCGGISSSWYAFKLLKRREEVHIEIGSCLDEEEKLNKMVEAHQLKHEFRDLLKFWTVYAFIALFDLYLEILISWIPFYYTLKFALFVWMFGPHGRGALVLFDHVIAPNVQTQEYWIDYIAGSQIQSSVKAAISGLGKVYIRTALAMASDEQLSFVEDELIVMKTRVLEERSERRKQKEKKADDDQSISSEPEFSSRETSPAPPLGRNTTTSATSSSYMNFSLNELKQNENITWMMSAVGGVINMAASTKNVLMGGGDSEHDLDESMTLEAEPPQPPPLPPVNSEAYDFLSDYEDENSHQSEDAKAAQDEDYEYDEEDEEDNDGSYLLPRDEQRVPDITEPFEYTLSDSFSESKSSKSSSFVTTRRRYGTRSQLL